MAQSRKRRKTTKPASETSFITVIDHDSKGNRYGGSPEVIAGLREIEAELRAQLGEFTTKWELEDFVPRTVPMIMDKIRASFADGPLYSDDGLDSMITACIPVVTNRPSGRRFKVIYTSGAIALMSANL